MNLFDGALRLLHPVMPFITEEIWHAMYDGQPPLKSIALAAYPAADEAQIDLATETEMSILQDLIVSVRNLRAELKVEPKVKVPIEVFAHEPEIRRLIEQNRGAVERLGSVESLKFVESALAGSAGVRSTARFDVLVLYEKKVDVAAERERLNKDLEKIEKEIANSLACCPRCRPPGRLRVPLSRRHYRLRRVSRSWVDPSTPIPRALNAGSTRTRGRKASI